MKLSQDPPASPNDDSLVEFGRTASPCRLCEQQLSSVQDRPLHWRSCSNQGRQTVRARKSIYMHESNMAESEFNKLKEHYSDRAVDNAGRKFFWMMQAMEMLGEKKYRSLLETYGYAVATSKLDRDILEVMISRLTVSGNTLPVVMAMEDALGYESERGTLLKNNLTTRVDLLPNWKKYEVECLKDYLDEGKSFLWIFHEFSDWDRVKKDALPGRTREAVAVWLFKLTKVGDKGL